tara:strand:- start:8040 stop:8744 length:705 start_codon:yes stop_codon:yes gene_type:complete
MLFRFPKPKLNLDIVTYRQEILELYPIDYTKKFIPRWYKDMPANVSETPIHEPTLKGCVAVQDLFNNGLCIPIWSDCIMYKDEKFNMKFSDGLTEVHFHPEHQWKYYLDGDRYLQFKIISPWAIRTKSNIKFVFTGFHWGLNPFNIHIPTAIMRFKYSHGTNINGFLDMNSFNKASLNVGKPLVQIIPLTDSQIKLNYHLEDTKTFYGNQNKFRLYFINAHKRLEKRIKEKNDT